MKPRVTIVIALLAFIAGASASWSWRSTIADRELLQLGAIHQLEVANLCTGALGLTSDGNIDRAQQLLHWRLESAIGNLYRAPVEATQWEADTPNLRHALPKSIAYLRQTDSRYAAWAEEVMRRAQ